ncbi:HAD-like protein [Aspergillus japonicus CBS 114.51]|uniref:HAD-like protein n=2 Tax=Aspergillus TaxID=5052 RepID=A0A2V5HJE3_ASPV1|nr:HAD-like protein [Aspergillus japonicus CBS 114.51]PYI23831.1 HAD-like protein [Aspergillus violaceofuscus CBS 115571]RAH79874.1 HAD-like protein [Aspergillus japonicus CBS 114.51]
MTQKYDLIILDFDGTIYDSHEAIYTSMQRTFHHFLPDHPLPTTQLTALIAQGHSPEVTFRALLDPATAREVFDEATWITTYRTLYAEHGHPLTRPYPAAYDLVRTLTQTHRIPVAIVSNKAVGALRAALQRDGFLAFIPEALVLGDGAFPRGRRKPDPAGFTEGLVPRLKAYYSAHGGGGGGGSPEWLEREGGVDMRRVLMVGDTITDLRFARNLGCPVCWCRFGQGDAAECEAAGPEVVIDGLEEFVGSVLG